MHLTNRFNAVCKEATHSSYIELSGDTKKEFMCFYLVLRYEEMDEESFQRYFYMINEEWYDWLAK